ncbi:myosin [Arabidopsis thaliana]|uniref:Myosin n=1 Tax=Arabidopsis thaliana TaxID=3702 RepID=F4K5I9_ARATH|nr:myosin [Arabidopsis thaliana]AED92849.1 myosin [Arabidopsis thaliana]|eukprot:NP_197547.1 myosin [Arabidopsis thaliana]
MHQDMVLLVREPKPEFRLCLYIVFDFIQILIFFFCLMFIQTWLHSEQEAAKDLRKALSEAEARNLELATELETVTRKLDQLQESVQRFNEYLNMSLKMAARDTGALREAKDKLEKRVEELTLRLQLETRQRTDLEEAKTQEYAKQQEALQAMWLQVEEANAVVVREREAARKAIEEAPPVIKEIPVLVEDTEKINSLTSEVEALKAERQAAEHLEKAFSETEARNSELATELENATRKADQLHESVQRLEEKLSNSESEIQVLRQQALAISGETKTTPEDILVKCISQNLGYNGDMPVAACVIYKCLLHWRSFELERTSVFDRIIETIGSAVEVLEDNEVLAYWLSNLASLSLFLEQIINAARSASTNDINGKFGERKSTRKCCSDCTLGKYQEKPKHNGEYVKAGLAELEQWCIEATDEYAGSAWDELRHIRQAVGFLVTYQKPKMSLAVITSFFPVLSIQQLYRISTNYWDEKYGTHSVSSDVIANMRVMMTEDSNNAVSSSFLLDEDDSIPFTVGDITESMEQVNVNDIELPQLIRENSSFSFLLTRKEASPS